MDDVIVCHFTIIKDGEENYYAIILAFFNKVFINTN